MRKKVLIVLGFILASCSSNDNTLIDKTKSNLSNISKNPEVIKLEKRRERWINANKCLRAIDASRANSNGNDKKLCKNYEDIHKLAEEIGIVHSSKIIRNYLKELDYYEKQLNDGIINKLPKDAVITVYTSLSLAENHSDIVGHQIELTSIKMETCNIKAQIARLERTNINPCEYIRHEYNTWKKQEDARHKKQIEAIDYFRDNYQPSP